MHAARAGESDHLRLPRTPLLQRGGPLAGTVQRVHLLAGIDDAAIEETRDERRQFAGRHRDHDFIEQREALLDLPLTDQRSTLQMSGAGDQVRLRELVADLRRVGGSYVRSPTITGRQLLLCDRQQEVAVLDAVASRFLEQPMRTREPACRAARLALKG